MLASVTGLDFQYESGSSGTAYGQFAAQVDGGGYNMVNIDVNGDQQTDFSAANNGNVNIAGNLSFGTQTVLARAVDYMSFMSGGPPGPWQSFTLTVNPPANSAPTIASLTFAQQSVSGQTAYGNLVGTISDSQSYSAQVEFDLDGNGTVDLGNVGINGVGFIAPISFPAGSHDINARVKEFDYVTGQNIVGAWQTYTIPLNQAPVAQDASFTIDENADEGVLVGSVVATDPDINDSLTYEMISGDTGNDFTIDLHSGQIRVASGANLNFESTPQRTLTIAVRDNGLPQRSDTATVFVSLRDIEERPTVDVSEVQDIIENRSHVVQLEGNDPQGDDVSFSIVGGSDAGKFEIVSDAQGVFHLKFASPPDFESPTDSDSDNIYQVTLRANDGNGNTRDKTVLVLVRDEGSLHAPVFSQDEYTFTVAEDIAVGSLVGTAAATDEDGDIWSYEVTGGNGKFDIDFLGKISLTSKLDYEQNPWHLLNVLVTDQYGLTDTARVTVKVTNVADEPVFNGGPYSASIPEDSTIGTEVGTYTATDPQSDPITYQLASRTETDFDQHGPFAINPATGNVTVKGALDFETRPKYVFQITANDGNGNQSTVDLTVDLTDVDDKPTISPKNLTVATDENVNDGTPLATFSAYEPQGQPISWSLKGQAEKFKIDSSGNVTLDQPLDFETESSYRMDVIASDPDGNQDTARLTVNVNDVSDLKFEPISDVTIPEDQGEMTIVIAHASGPNGDATSYTLSGGDNTFAMYYFPNGRIQLVGQLDYSVKPVYQLTVSATDSTGETASITFKVRVSVDPKFVDSSRNQTDTYEFLLGEGTREDANAGSATTAIDNDNEDEKSLKFEITDGNDLGLFRYDGNQLRFVSDLPLGGPSHYTLVVQVTDSDGNWDRAVVTLTMVPLVVLTGDTQAVEATGDAISVNIVRYSNDLSGELSVTYKVVWETDEHKASAADFIHPETLVDEGETERTVVFEPGQSVISITLVPRHDKFGEIIETVIVKLVDPPDSSYISPYSNGQAITDQGENIGLVGSFQLALQILDGVTLFGADNDVSDLQDHNSYGVHWNDIDQDSLGDCYFLAPLAAIAKNDPQGIVDLFTDNGDGTVSIKFYKVIGQDPTEIKLPLTLDFGISQSALTKDTDSRGYVEIWPQVLEAAYREFLKQELPGVSIVGGDAEIVFERLTGYEHDSIVILPNGHQDADDQWIADLFKSNQVFTLSTYASFGDNAAGATGIVQNHAYVVTRYLDQGTSDLGDDIILLFNPHKPLAKRLEITFARLRTYFDFIVGDF